MAASGGCYDLVNYVAWEARVLVCCVNLALRQGAKGDVRRGTHRRFLGVHPPGPPNLASSTKFSSEETAPHEALLLKIRIPHPEN